jgi:hypothetical protein
MVLQGHDLRIRKPLGQKGNAPHTHGLHHRDTEIFLNCAAHNHVALTEPFKVLLLGFDMAEYHNLPMEHLFCGNKSLGNF